MALESIQVSAVIPASPDRIFEAWLSSKEHTAFTGGQATIEPRVGGRHTAWDGYIEGVNLALEEGHRILQSWRSSDFPDGSTYSKLEVLLEPADGGTKVTLVHTDIPEGQGRLYEQGWVDNYITPMQEYFLEGDEDDDLESDLPAGNFPPPDAPPPVVDEVEDEGWGDPTPPPPLSMPAEIEDEPMEAPAQQAPKPKKKAPVVKKKAPVVKKKAPVAKKKAPKPAAKKKAPKPAAKKKAPKPAKKKTPAKKKAPVAKKKAPKPAKKKGKR